MPKVMEDTEYVRTTARIPREEYDRLRRIAISEGRSINSQIIAIIKVAFAMRDRGGKIGK